jgi:four helix bundle protein
MDGGSWKPEAGSWKNGPGKAWGPMGGPEPREAPARSFEDLQVWQKAHAFVLEVYRLTEAFPKAERFGLTAQLRRAAVSVPANIAEGFGKRSKADKARFLNTAQGSLEECRYYLVLCRDLQYADPGQCCVLLDVTGRLLSAYVSAVLASIS